MTKNAHIREQKQGEGFPSFVIRLIFALPALVALFWSVRLSNHAFALVELYALLLPVLAIIYLHVLIHELGHIVAGLAVDFDLVYLSVGPLQLQRHNGKFKLSKVRLKGFSGGLAAAFPTSTENLRHRYAIFAAGGPFAGLVMSAVSYIAYVTLPHLPVWASFLVLFAAIYSLLAALVNLMPLHYAGFRVDGAHLLSALRGNDKDRHNIAHLALEAAMHHGVRPRDWDASLVMRDPLPGQRGIDILFIDLMKWYYAWDHGQLAEAGQHLARVMQRKEDYPLANRKALYYEAAYFWFRYVGDTAQACEWLASEGSEIMPEPYYQPAVEAAMAFAAGEAELAVVKAKQALELLQESPFLGIAKMMRDDLERLISDSGNPQVL